MSEKILQIASLLVVIGGGLGVGWLYWAAPQTLEDVSVKARETLDTATIKAQVLTNTYEVDQAKFDEGLRTFRADNFILARDLFSRADPEKRDAKTQFYIAYSFYRQGWGKLSDDDELFGQGLAQVNRVTQLDKDFKSNDGDLKMQTPIELKNEFEEGLRVTASDFNPLRVFRERK